MHEVGLAQRTLEIALEAAQRQGAMSIRSMHLRIGELSGVEPDALRFALEVVTQGTCADGAEITLEPVSAACCCAACGQRYGVSQNDYQCPSCGLINHELCEGREMDLVSMEVL